MSKQLIQADPTRVKSTEGIDKDRSLKVSEYFMNTIQGEGVSTGAPAAFLRLTDCTLNCVFCFGDGTQILMEDFSTKNIKDIEVGDRVLSLNRRGPRLKNKMETTTVTAISSKESETVLLNGKTPVTLNHKFLYKKYRPVWQQLKNLKGKEVKYIDQNNIINNDEYWKGWLSGIIDGDGCFFNFKQGNNSYLRFKIGLNEKHVIDIIQNKLEYFGYSGIQRREDKKLNIIEMTRVEQATRLKEFIEYKVIKDPKLYDKDYLKGYLAGFFDAEGYQDHSEIRVSQKNYELIDMIHNFSSELGFNSTIVDTKKNGMWVLRIIDVINFFATCRPNLKIYKSTSTASIKNKINLEFDENNITTQTVYNMTTEAGSYVADGYIVSNCDSSSVWKYGNLYSFDELFKMMEESGLIEQLKNGVHLVLTGGSPLRQQKQLESFLIEFFDKFDFLPFIEIENECTLMPSDNIINLIGQWNNSPKLENSENKKKVRYKPEVIKQLSELDNSWFKFVISEEANWNEIEEDFLKPGLIKREQIILMPEGDTREKLTLTQEMAASVAIREGVRFCNREHVVLWNKRTGV